MTKQRFAIVIPALNEAETITPVIKGVSVHGTVIVVDDGSTDQTAQVAESAGAVVVSLPENQGYDGALAAGFAKALALGADAIASIDADGQHDPRLIETLKETILSDGVDIAVGIRPKPARFAEWVFRHYADYRYSVKDILCGLKAYRAPICEKYGKVASLSTIGTGLTLAAAKDGAVIRQFPITVRDREDTPRLGRKFRANYLILKALLMNICRSYA